MNAFSDHIACSQVATHIRAYREQRDLLRVDYLLGCALGSRILTSGLARCLLADGGTS